MKVDKFILRRPSLKQLGVENKVTRLLTTDDFVRKHTQYGFQIEDGWEKIQTVVNWDKVPNIVVGVVGHEEDGVLRLYSAKYLVEKLKSETITDESGEFKINISKDSVSVTKFSKLLERPELYDYAYDFDKSKKMALPVAVEPRMVKDDKVKYRKGRIIIPAMTIKEKYYELLIDDFTEFHGTLDSAQVHIAESKEKSSENIEIPNPILMYIYYGIKHLSQDKDFLQKEMEKITEEDKKKFGIDNEWRILGIKLALGEIKVPIV